MIDLIKYGQLDKNNCAGVRDVHRIVRLAVEVVIPHQNDQELIGVRRCVDHLLRNIAWRDQLCGFRIGALHKPFGWDVPPEDISFVSNSIIATTNKYRAGLKEFHSGLAIILQADFVRGIARLLRLYALRGRFELEGVPRLAP